MEKYIKLRRDDTLESAVYTLLAAKARGEDVYCLFEGAKLHSADVTIESAKEAVAKLEASRKESLEKLEEEARAQRERRTRDLVEANRALAGTQKITLETVVNGLEFIKENQLIPQELLVDGLLSLGCNFTFEDIKTQFPKVERTKLFKGMKKGYIATGATVIVNVRDSESARDYCDDRFLSVDDNTSIYHFIRVANRKLRFRRRLAAIIGA